jgi:hypothetical protein
MTPNKGDVMQREDVFAEGAIDRIFNGEAVPQLAKSGEIHHVRMRGFHYEDPEVMRERGYKLIEDSRTSSDTRGVYRAAIQIEGVRRRGTHYGFFPLVMSRDEILQAIAEAYENRIVVNASNLKLCKGSGGGLPIWMELDEAGGRVTDAWPRRAKYTRMQAALWLYATTGKRSKLLCPVCLQPKTLCCTHGHWPPKRKSAYGRFMRRILKRLRYRFSGRPRLKA